MYYFATLFDINYLSRGLSLLESMQKNIANFHLFVLCLDVEVYEYWQNNTHKNVTAIALSTLESKDEALKEAKKNRSKVEYYFTLSPVLPLYILENYAEVDLITTLDADIYFYSNPEPIFKELENKSILITPHRFGQKLKHLELYGKYNVSYQAFRRDENGLACLTWWREKCIEWCSDIQEEDRFADQKYLDFFEQKFKGVVAMENIGAGSAPWNIDNYELTIKNNTFYLDNQPLIFYHYHHLRFVSKAVATHGLFNYQCLPEKFPKIAKLYQPYIKSLQKMSTNLQITNSDKNLTRITVKQYSKTELHDLLIYNYTFVSLPLLGTISVHLENYYHNRFLRSIIHRLFDRFYKQLL